MAQLRGAGLTASARYSNSRRFRAVGRKASCTTFKAARTVALPLLASSSTCKETFTAQLRPAAKAPVGEVAAWCLKLCPDLTHWRRTVDQIQYHRRIAGFCSKFLQTVENDRECQRRSQRVSQRERVNVTKLLLILDCQ